MKLKTRIKISMVGIMAAMVAIYTAIILGSTIQTYRRDMEDSLRSVGEQEADDDGQPNEHHGHHHGKTPV